MQFAFGDAVIAAISPRILGVLAVPVLIVALVAIGMAARRSMSLRQSIGFIAPIIAVVVIVEFAFVFLYSFTSSGETYVGSGAGRAVPSPIATPPR